MKLTKQLLVLASFGALVVGYHSAAQAAGKTEDQKFKVSANVVAGCTLTLAPIAFGNYDPINGAALTATANWTVKCTKGAALQIAIGNGQHAVNALTNGMTLGGLIPGGDKLGYTLVNSSGTPWNNATLSIPDGNGTDQTVTVTGKLPANQNVAVGDGYEDQVVATVNW